MKKAFLIFFIAIISSIVSFGQLQEVKGVETKLTTYYNGSSTWFGYSFYNMNSIPVSVEVELHESSQAHDRVIEVKTFNLQPKEEYVWKFEGKFWNNRTEYPFRCYDGRKAPENEVYINERWLDCSYYVKYKAYKIL